MCCWTTRSGCSRRASGVEEVRRSVSLAFDVDLGAPFLASLARSGDFALDAPLRGRWPLAIVFELDFFFFIAMTKVSKTIRHPTQLVQLARARISQNKRLTNKLWSGRNAASSD